MRNIDNKNKEVSCILPDYKNGKALYPGKTWLTVKQVHKLFNIPLNKLYTAIKYKQIKHTIVKGTGPTKSKALFLPEYIEEYNHKVFNEGFLGIDYEN